MSRGMIVDQRAMSFWMSLRERVVRWDDPRLAYKNVTCIDAAASNRSAPANEYRSATPVGEFRFDARAPAHGGAATLLVRH
jgi:hypothetical protein